MSINQIIGTSIIVANAKANIKQYFNTCVWQQGMDKLAVASVARELNQSRQAALAALRAVDESQAEAVFHKQLASFAQICKEAVATSRS